MTTLPSPLRDDLLDPEVNHDPYPAFAALREEDPVHYSETHRAWLVTRYDDVAAAFGDARLSSDRVRPLLAALSPERRFEAGPVMELIADWMVVTDQPRHTRLRKLATAAFRPRQVAAMEGRVRELVEGQLDEFVAGGEQELVAGFSMPLPATVIAELIGAPAADAERFALWSRELALVAFGAGGDGRGERHRRALASIEEMLSYIGELIERERVEPGGETMIAGLVAGDGDGERLDDEEIKGMCALMLFAGHETTTTTITSAVKLLIEHPDQLEMVRADPALAGRAVEEVLRFEGAIKVLHRWVLEDLELRGREIAAGDRVLLIPAAANRDPDRFVEPDRFDVSRSPNPHLAFGRGAHACIGAMLARMEMRVAITAIVERLPGLRFAAAEPRFDWTPSLASRGLVELKVAHGG
ncbi:MAG TPA: cytochrome P450 [Solirubrobacterales bacterium]|nr:cytochrome P450 [Solirubrobacterales bacterium]